MWYSGFAIGFAAAVAWTPHCLGMCGGFPLHLARSSREGFVVLRQILFVLGKAFTYVFLGAIASALGVVLFRDTPLARIAPLLPAAAGAITVLFGLLMLGFRMPSFGPLQKVADAGLVRTLFGGLLSSPRPLSAFVLGLGVGFIPCPVPVIMLGLAAAAHSIPYGMALMAGVGLGTAPGLLGVGLLGVGLDRRFARLGMRVAGVAVLMIGILTIGRATGVVPKSSAVNKIVPPCCSGAVHHAPHSGK